MQILLSCAKNMASQCLRNDIEITTPMFNALALNNAKQMSQYSVEELEQILKINQQLASINKLRYERFETETNMKPAIFAYNGIAYKELDANSLSTDDVVFAANHLWITSFLYGLLRASDGIKDYRLEGNVFLPDNNKTMFDFWKPHLTSVFIDSIKKDDGILVNLASKEMKKLFDWKSVSKEVDVVEPEFMTYKNGKLKNVTVYAKMCRGAMTRFIIKNRLDSVEPLKEFNYNNFKYDEASSKKGKMMFVI